MWWTTAALFLIVSPSIVKIKKFLNFPQDLWFAKCVLKFEFDYLLFLIYKGKTYGSMVLSFF